MTTFTQQPWYQARMNVVSALLSNAAEVQLRSNSDLNEVRFASTLFATIAYNCQAPDTPMNRDRCFEGVCDTPDEFIAWGKIDPLYTNWNFFTEFAKLVVEDDVKSSAHKRGRLFESYWHTGDIDALKQNARSTGMWKRTFLTRIILHGAPVESDKDGYTTPLIYDSATAAGNSQDVIDGFVEKRFAMEADQTITLYYKDGRHQLAQVKDFRVDENGRRDYPQIFVGSWRNTNIMKRNHKVATDTAFIIDRKGKCMFLGDLYWLMRMAWEFCLDTDRPFHSISALESMHEQTKNINHPYSDEEVPTHGQLHGHPSDEDDDDTPVVFTDHLTGSDWIAEKIAWFVESTSALDITVNRDDSALRSLARDILERISVENQED